MIDNNDKILIICCTKNRPQICQRMIKSYKETKGSINTSIMFCLDKTDINLAEYLRILDGQISIIESPNYQTQIFNLVSKELFPDFDYYGMVNDDHIFRTENWDTELVKTIQEKGNGFGLAHANSLWYDSDVICRHPSFFILSSNIIKALDYAAYPKLRHFKLDTYFKDLTEPLGLLFYREDIIIEHMHLHVGKAENDENYKWAYCPEEQAHGDWAYAEWRLMWSNKDRSRISKMIEKAKQNKQKGE